MEKKVFKTSDDLQNAILGVIDNYNPKSNDIKVFKVNNTKNPAAYEFEIKGKFLFHSKAVLKKVLNFLHTHGFIYSYDKKAQSFEIYTVQNEELRLKSC